MKSTTARTKYSRVRCAVAPTRLCDCEYLPAPAGARAPSSSIENYGSFGFPFTRLKYTLDLEIVTEKNIILDTAAETYVYLGNRTKNSIVHSVCFNNNEYTPLAIFTSYKIVPLPPLLVLCDVFPLYLQDSTPSIGEGKKRYFFITDSSIRTIHFDSLYIRHRSGICRRDRNECTGFVAPFEPFFSDRFPLLDAHRGTPFSWREKKKLLLLSHRFTAFFPSRMFTFRFSARKTPATAAAKTRTNAGAIILLCVHFVQCAEMNFVAI